MTPEKIDLSRNYGKASLHSPKHSVGNTYLTTHHPGSGHVTPEKTDLSRDYDKIAAAGAAARAAAAPGAESAKALAAAVGLSYEAQLGEGMAPLAGHGALARKYCGGG